LIVQYPRVVYYFHSESLFNGIFTNSRPVHYAAKQCRKTTMKTISHSARLVLLLALLLLSMLVAAPTEAAPAVYQGSHNGNPGCLDHKLIPFWGSRNFIEAQGFNFDIVGDQASVKFQRNLSLDLSSNQASSAYTASRMTEIDTWKPIDERVKCWQATPSKNVVIEFRARFDQSATPPGLTENLMLWNAPFPSTTPEAPQPVTSIGVSRNSILGQPQYVAAVTQDLNFGTFTPPFIFQTTPMPAWLNAGDWHRVKITLSQQAAQIDVAQGDHQFATVLKAALLHPAEPLGFEFSVDNELFPGLTVPVSVPDGLDVSYLSMHMERAR